MDSMLISLSILLIWWVIGYGPLAALAAHQPPLARVLLAPALGLAIVTIFTFWINRLGYPVQTFATPQVTTLALASVAVAFVAHLRSRRPSITGDLQAFALLLPLVIGAMVLVGWPGILRGLNWLGYANDDMGNYVLNIQRLRSHGYFDPPSLGSIIDASDIGQYYWTSTLEQRNGADLTLAVIASVMNRMPVPLFMPSMLALHGALIAAVSALLVTERPRRATAIAAITAIAINPLVGFSTYSELLAQVGGMALAGAFLALSVDPWRHDWRSLLRITPLAGIPLFALFIWYPEITLMVLAAVALYLLVNSRQTLNAWRRLLPAVTAILLAIALLSGSYMIVVVGFLKYQISVGAGTNPSDALVFPYFLVKAGLTSFWGLTMIADLDWQHIANWELALGLVMFAFAAWTIVASLRQRRLSGCVTATLCLLCFLMLWRRADFGVFKAVLYLHPFLAAIMAAQMVDLVFGRGRGTVTASPAFELTWRIPRLPHRWSILPIVGIGAIIAVVVPTQLKTLLVYGRIAADWPGSGAFNELPGSTRDGLVTDLEKLDKPGPGGRYVIDSYNPVLTKLIASYTVGTPARIVSFNPFKLDDFAGFFSRIYPEQADKVEPLKSARIPFIWATSGATDYVRLDARGRDLPDQRDVLVAAFGDNSVLNRRELGYPQPMPIMSIPVDKIENHLVFIPTKQRALSYFDYDAPPELFAEARSHVALWPNEADYFYPGRSVAGAGRYILLGIINPQPASHLMLELSSTFKNDGRNILPPVQVIGESATPLGALGRGSARLFSRALTPTRLDQWSVLGIDMGVDGRQLKGKDGQVVIDPRSLTAHVRDISLVTDDAFRAMRPPSVVSGFPQALLDKDLEYSGIYEDGWMGEVAYLRLAAPSERSRFHVAGRAPWDPATSGVSQVAVAINGAEKARTALKQGEFNISFDVDPSNEPIRVEINANGTNPLSAADNRPASLYLSAVGWRPDPREFRPQSDAARMTESEGIWSDGWMGQVASLRLAAPSKPSRFHVTGTAPWDPATSGVSQIAVAINGAEKARTILKQGEFNISFDLDPMSDPVRVQISANGTAPLSAADPRHASVNLSAIGWNPDANEFRPGSDAAAMTETQGIWSDGWMGEVASLRLAAPSERTRFHVTGTTPWDPETSGISQIVIAINGVEKARQTLKQGDFNILFDVDPSNEPVRVQITANGTAALSAPDTRRASVHLSAVGWSPDSGEFRSGRMPQP